MWLGTVWRWTVHIKNLDAAFSQSEVLGVFMIAICNRILERSWIKYCNRHLPILITTTKIPNGLCCFLTVQKLYFKLYSRHLLNLAFSGYSRDVVSALCSDPFFHPLSNSAVKNCQRLVLNLFTNSQLFERQEHQSWQESGMLSIGMCLSENHTLGCQGSLRSHMHVFQGNAGTGAWWCVWG